MFIHKPSKNIEDPKSQENFVIAHVDSLSYLVTVMGLMVPWSLTLAVVDGYSVFVRHLPPQTRVTSIIVTGDWVRDILCGRQNIINIFVLFLLVVENERKKHITFAVS